MNVIIAKMLTFITLTKLMADSKIVIVVYPAFLLIPDIIKQRSSHGTCGSIQEKPDKKADIFVWADIADLEAIDASLRGRDGTGDPNSGRSLTATPGSHQNQCIIQKGKSILPF